MPNTTIAASTGNDLIWYFIKKNAPKAATDPINDVRNTQITHGRIKMIARIKFFFFSLVKKNIPTESIIKDM